MTATRIRAATVEEVANMVVYLASPLASATTGAALRVDGDGVAFFNERNQAARGGFRRHVADHHAPGAA